MSELFQIIYHPDLEKRDFPHLAPEILKRILKAIDTKLVHFPQEFGEPLRRTFKGYWKLRVGDYRVIYKITGKTILVLRIGHRRNVYEQ